MIRIHLLKVLQLEQKTVVVISNNSEKVIRADIP